LNDWSNQLCWRERELRCRDQQIASLRAQLEQATDDVQLLETKLDTCLHNYDNSTRHSASLESEISGLQQLLQQLQHQVIGTTTVTAAPTTTNTSWTRSRVIRGMIIPLDNLLSDYLISGNYNN